MPLEIYARGGVWWARGSVEYRGRKITGYLRESTGTSDEADAGRWCTNTEEAAIRRHLFGGEAGSTPELTFADCIEFYLAPPRDAERLLRVLPQIGHLPVKQITPKMVRELAARMFPDCCTDTWLRNVIAPVRATINAAHDELGGDRVPPMKVRDFTPKERIDQDKRRGKKSRVSRTPGSWPWLLQFRQHANPRLSALAFLMFVTGARVTQATTMHPKEHLDLPNARVKIPGAKGHDDRWVEIPVELVVELANLVPQVPRGFDDKPENLRVFGYARRDSFRKSWMQAEADAGIQHLPPHSAGRHGFGQEMGVRQPVDEKAAEEFGGWSATGVFKRTYNHSEDSTPKILAAFRTGIVQAEKKTGLKLLKTG